VQSMKSKIKELLKTILRNIFGIQITRIKKPPQKEPTQKSKMKYVHDPAFSYMKSPDYQRMLIDELSRTADDFFSLNYVPSISKLDPQRLVSDFFETFSTRILTDNTHGSGFHNAFWIYLFARVMDPELIVESGVWKAHTTWLLEQACPDAAIYGFDRNLKHVEYEDLKAILIEKDWNTYQFPEFDPDRALVFFDCHVNHAKRLLEASEKGFKHLLFDDNPPVYKIFSHVPGIPTAAMLQSGVGIDTPEISWVWNRKEFSREIDREEARKAKELIKIHHTLPDVGGPTRYGGFAFLTYVQI
jgi:hypothetical protein